jgi:CRP-like cAMP-binding protein
MGNNMNISQAMQWNAMVDEGIMRTWLTNMGQLSPEKQMAHLFSELFMRLKSVGFATSNGYDFPLTQTDLADILGLSNVHLNRTLQELRSRGLVVLKKRHLTIPDIDRLKAFCDFNEKYLHLLHGRAGWAGWM